MVIIKQKTQQSSNKQTFIQGRGYVDGIIDSIKNKALSEIPEECKILLSKIYSNKTKKISTETNKLLDDILHGVTKNF